MGSTTQLIFVLFEDFEVRSVGCRRAPVHKKNVLSFAVPSPMRSEHLLIMGIWLNAQGAGSDDEEEEEEEEGETSEKQTSLAMTKFFDKEP